MIVKILLSATVSVKFFSDDCAAQFKNFINLCHHKEILILMLNEYFLLPSMVNPLAMGLLNG